MGRRAEKAPPRAASSEGAGADTPQAEPVEGGAGATERVEVEEDGSAALFGVHDANLRALEQATGARLAARGSTVSITGPAQAVRLAAGLVRELAELVAEGLRPGRKDLLVAAKLVAESTDLSLRDVLLETAVTPSEGKRLVPRTPMQHAYLRSIRRRDIVFAIGPAGTGKTYLAVALALESLRQRAARRIVLTRPAVEAGERLGFLPGDLVEKVNPYLRPLHDAIRDLADHELAHALLERGDLEVAPLAFMRGRTLNDAFIILDEAQNTTQEQMKMFLTRMGMNSKMVITGDVTQVDLPPGRISGLSEAARLLRDIDGIDVIEFTDRDVVRHDLVQAIVRAYERHSARNDDTPEGRGREGS